LKNKARHKNLIINTLLKPKRVFFITQGFVINRINKKEKEMRRKTNALAGEEDDNYNNKILGVMI
jgi:hypothetical protein